MNGFLELVEAERNRQIEDEGWTHDHDDIGNSNEELACAASCYALPPDYRHGIVPQNWRWDFKWWKPKEDRKRELVVAAALLFAEYERLNRMEK